MNCGLVGLCAQDATLRDMEQLEKDMSVVMELLADIAETIDRGTETIHNITVSQCHCASKQRLMLDVI